MKDLIRDHQNRNSCRLRPVIMTALVASSGIPSNGAPTGSGAEVRPLATVAIGGLLDGNLIDLVGASFLYYWFEKIKPRRARSVPARL